MKKQFYILAETGLHARPATKFVNLAMHFKSDLKLTWQHKTIDLKSIMGLMSLGIYQGETITVEATGDDEERALKEIQLFLFEEHLAKEV
jgi:phosphocarrier protein HPr